MQAESLSASAIKFENAGRKSFTLGMESEKSSRHAPLRRKMANDGALEHIPVLKIRKPFGLGTRFRAALNTGNDPRAEDTQVLRAI
jgi:hypothetical protein